ncbi:MAG: hypothetical protein NC191_03820 [Muribaculaceae bacterium]|nr:hypothetical protein [Muribaculaceae bacterium]
MLLVINQEVELEEWLSQCHCVKFGDDYITDGVLVIKKEFVEECVDLEDYDIQSINQTLLTKDFSKTIPFELPSQIKLNKNTWELQFVINSVHAFNYYYVRLIYNTFDVAYLKILRDNNLIANSYEYREGLVLIFYNENDEIIALLPSITRK